MSVDILNARTRECIYINVSLYGEHEYISPAYPIGLAQFTRVLQFFG